MWLVPAWFFLQKDTFLKNKHCAYVARARRGFFSSNNDFQLSVMFLVAQTGTQIIFCRETSKTIALGLGIYLWPVYVYPSMSALKGGAIFLIAFSHYPNRVTLCTVQEY